MYGCNSTYRLRYWNNYNTRSMNGVVSPCCNSTYRLRYWNRGEEVNHFWSINSCNSTYRLRYWNPFIRLLNLSNSKVATVLTVYGIETYQQQTEYVHVLQLQQYLPFTVLKRYQFTSNLVTALGCNSTYRLRYIMNILTNF